MPREAPTARIVADGKPYATYHMSLPDPLGPVVAIGRLAGRAVIAEDGVVELHFSRAAAELLPPMFARVGHPNAVRLLPDAD